jgi:Lrp/AsnC family transcriptional regulator for asnA, asnC and gidA
LPTLSVVEVARIRWPASPDRGRRLAGSPQIDQTDRVTKPVYIDDKSKEVIALLQKDGRMSYTAIGNKVGLSEAAVRQRAQRLVEQGVMQIVAVTDPLQLGFTWEAMIGVCVSGNSEAIAETLGEIDAIDFIVLTAGKFDIILEVVAESEEQFIDLTNTIRSIPGVTASESLIYLSTRKQAYSWGVR